MPRIIHKSSFKTLRKAANLKINYFKISKYVFLVMHEFTSEVEDYISKKKNSIESI